MGVYLPAPVVVATHCTHTMCCSNATSRAMHTGMVCHVGCTNARTCAARASGVACHCVFGGHQCMQWRRCGLALLLTGLYACGPGTLSPVMTGACDMKCAAQRTTCAYAAHTLLSRPWLQLHCVPGSRPLNGPKLTPAVHTHARTHAQAPVRVPANVGAGHGRQLFCRRQASKEQLCGITYGTCGVPSRDAHTKAHRRWHCWARRFVAQNTSTRDTRTQTRAHARTHARTHTHTHTHTHTCRGHFPCCMKTRCRGGLRWF